MLTTHNLLATASESRTQSEVHATQHTILTVNSALHMAYNPQLIAVMYITLWPSQTGRIVFAHGRRVPPPPRIWFPR